MKKLVFIVAFALTQVFTAAAQQKAPRSAKKFDKFEAFNVPQARVDQVFMNKLQEEIQLLTRLAKQRKDPNQKADILYRLAESYLVYDKAIFFKQMAQYEKDFDLYVKGKTKKKPVEPEYTPKRSYKLFQYIIETTPKFPQLDEILFRAGYFGQALEMKESVNYYQRLIREYPKSQFRLDAFMQMGEYYFGHREFAKAIDAYKTVLREPSKIYNFALYKLSWCYYNQGNVRAAMTVMEQVVKSSMGVQNEIELREEALKDLVLFYSDLGLIDEAQQYFVSIGEPDYGIKVLEKLSDIYYTQARYDKAIETIRKLLMAVPLSESRPKYHAKLVESYEKSQRLPQAMAEMEVFISAYDKDSPWYAQNTDVDAREYVAERSEVYARFIPKKHHEIAQQLSKTDPDKSKLEYDRAISYYQHYLELFGDHKNAYDMRYLYAELLFKQKNYTDAAKQYGRVAKVGPKGNHHKDALVGQVDALSRLEEVYFKDLETKGIKKKGKYDPIPLSDYAESLIEADEFYVRSFPKDPRVSDTLLHRSQLFYNYNQFDKAQKGFAAIVKNYPDSAASNTARHLILDIYNINRDWENLEKWASTFLENKQFATPENKELLFKLIQGSIFQRAKDMEEKKQFSKAAETYLHLTQKYPTSEYADKAMFNAAIDYINADDSEKAMSTSQAFLQKFPTSILVPKMMLALASYFDDKLDYAHAAEYYEILAEKDPKSPSAADALFNAGLYRENLRHYSKALEDYKTYLERYPKAKDAAEIYFSTGLVYEKVHNWRDAADTFRIYPQRYGNHNKERNVEAYWRLANAMQKLRNDKEVEKAYQTVIFLNRKYNQDPSLGPNVGGKYAAKARFELVKPDFDEFNAIKFKVPQARLAATIEQKARLLTKLKNRYLEVINFGDAEMGVTALYHIGLIYQNFSESLFSTPVPKGLSPEETQTYQQELQSRAAPIEEKAVEAYEKAVQKSQELEVYNEWAKKSYDRLTQYKPDRYPPIRGKIHLERHISEPIAPYEGKKG